MLMFPSAQYNCRIAVLKSGSGHIKLDTFLRETYNICRLLPSVFMNYLSSSLLSPVVLSDSKEIQQSIKPSSNCCMKYIPKIFVSFS